MKKTLRETFADERVLITGHTGFKGSWLALWLSEMGADVTGFALAPEYERSHFELLGLAGRIKHIEGDLRDADPILECVEDFKPTFVFHLAAQALVRRSYNDPKATFDTNVGGGVNVMEAIRNQEQLKALVYITSDKAYSNKEWTWGYRENDELGGHDPYSASKAAAEMVFSSYFHSYLKGRDHLGTATTRAGNVIGGGDWSDDRIIPDCIRALESDTPIIIRSPEATRPWQHVLDPLHGYLQLAAALSEDPRKFEGSWNFGPDVGAGLTVLEVTERVIQHWGSGSLEIAANAGPFEHRLLQLSIDKAKLELRWKPRWHSGRSIKETVQWYRDVTDGANAIDVSRAQIKAFEESHDA